MSKVFLLAVAIFLTACRGQKVPRDYQNNPPAATHPVTSSQQTPTAQGLPGPAPEPAKGVEGKSNSKPVSPIPPSTTLKDQAPATKT
jgi:hypothetical protein